MFEKGELKDVGPEAMAEAEGKLAEVRAEAAAWFARQDLATLERIADLVDPEDVAGFDSATVEDTAIVLWLAMIGLGVASLDAHKGEPQR